MNAGPKRDPRLAYYAQAVPGNICSKCKNGKCGSCNSLKCSCTCHARAIK